MIIGDLLAITQPEAVACRDYGTCGCAHDPKIGKHVFIELSGLCNLDCEFCAYSWSTRRRGRMELPLLAKILKDLRKLEPVDYIMFSALGEPTLHPEFAEACRMVHRAGYPLVVTTNGTRLTPEMAELPVDEMFISLNIFDPITYAIKHSPVSLEELVGRLRAFADAVPLYDTCLYFFSANPRDYPEARGLIDKTDPACAARFQSFLRRICPEAVVESPIPDCFRLHAHLYAAIKPFTLWANFNVPPHLTVREAASIPAASCNFYKHHISILNDGRVTLCCGDYDAALSLGNVRDEPLRKIFLRKYDTPDLAVHSFCRRCKGTVAG